MYISDQICVNPINLHFLLYIFSWFVCVYGACIDMQCSTHLMKKLFLSVIQFNVSLEGYTQPDVLCIKT